MTESDERLSLPHASAWRRYELCGGSWQLEQEAKRLGQAAHGASPVAKRGVLKHAFLAGQPDEDGKEIVLTDTEEATVNFLQERAQGEVQRIFGEEPTQELNEQRLWLTLNGQRVASGRFDRVVYTATTALVIDFKTGFSEPDPAEQNAQIKVLAVLVALHLPRTLREVVVQVISGPYGVTEARYDYPALAKAYDDILRTLKAIQNPLAPLNPSPEACRYCPAAMICQPCRDLLSPPTKFQVATLPEDPERAAKLLDEITILESAFEAVKKYYAERLSTDPAYRISGWGMMPGAVRREVTDWETARRRLAEWLDLSEIEAASNYRLGDLERALGKKLGLRGKELKERMNAILQGLVDERPNAASLKRVKGKPQLFEMS
jgi:CRISPR/Cas system-associated exonuclease Cas4 (RecB family)